MQREVIYDRINLSFWTAYMLSSKNPETVEESDSLLLFLLLIWMPSGTESGFALYFFLG